MKLTQHTAPKPSHLAHWTVIVYRDGTLWRAQAMDTRSRVTYDVPGAKKDYFVRLDTAWMFLENITWGSTQAKRFTARELVNVQAVA